METNEITYRDRLEQIRLFAKAYGWREVSADHENGRLVYRRKGMKVEVLYNTASGLTVLSSLNHPKLGTTQMVRKRVTYALLEQIFDNPRTHTSIGYIEKKPTNRDRWSRRV